MSDYKYKTRGEPEPRKRKAQEPEFDYYDPQYDRFDEEPFNLERGTGLRYPGQWLESMAQRSFLNDNEDYSDEDYDEFYDEEDYY